MGLQIVLLNSYYFVNVVPSKIKNPDNIFHVNFVQLHQIFLMQVWHKTTCSILYHEVLTYCLQKTSFLYTEKNTCMSKFLQFLLQWYIRKIIIFLVKHIRCLQCFLYVCQEVGVGKAASLARDLHLF